MPFHVLRLCPELVSLSYSSLYWLGNGDEKLKPLGDIVCVGLL